MLQKSELRCSILVCTDAIERKCAVKKTEKLTLTALLTAAALILGWLEHTVPLITSIPGLKLGISNIAVVFALYRLGIGCAASVMTCKVLLSALLFGGFSSFAYSAAGGLLSFLIMAAACKSRHLSPIGVSSAGGAAHITAQVLIAALITSTPRIMWLLAPLLAAGTVTGALTGLAAALILKRTGRASEKGGNGNAYSAEKHKCDK